MGSMGSIGSPMGQAPLSGQAGNRSLFFCRQLLRELRRWRLRPTGVFLQSLRRWFGSCRRNGEWDFEDILKVSPTAMSMWGTIISYPLLPPENGGQWTFWRSQLAIHQVFRGEEDTSSWLADLTFWMVDIIVNIWTHSKLKVSKTQASLWPTFSTFLVYLSTCLHVYTSGSTCANIDTFNFLKIARWRLQSLSFQEFQGLAPQLSRIPQQAVETLCSSAVPIFKRLTAKTGWTTNFLWMLMMLMYFVFH